MAYTCDIEFEPVDDEHAALREWGALLVLEYNMLRYNLTPRQREIVHAIWLCSPTLNELAGVMGVSIETIKSQTTLMYERVGVKDRLNLILKLLGKGTVSG